MNDSTTLRDARQLERLAASALEAVGATNEEAWIVARSLVAADARGIHSHGLLRLPLYIEAVERGGIVADAPMTWTVEHGATAALDAASGFGQVAMHRAVAKAEEIVRAQGAAVVSVANNTHYGAGGYWTDRLAETGLVAILVATTGVAVAPFGSAQKFIGTNPLSISFPTGERPVTADLATSAGAYGKIVQAAGEGSPIPEGWAIDAVGNPTTRPEDALAGSLLPFGGPKGSALAVLIELLAGAAAGGRFAHETVDIWVDPASRMGTGALLIAFDPASLHGDDLPVRRAQAFRERLRGLEPAPGFRGVVAPGDLEASAAASAATEVALPRNVDEALEALAARLGVDAAAAGTGTGTGTAAEPEPFPA